MPATRSRSRGFLHRAAPWVVGGVLMSVPLAAQWPQWGGPDRDFNVDARDLAETWPQGGPPVLWRRPLGENGHSSILVDGAHLYTMTRRGDDDVVVALDAASGDTVWETAYAAPTKPGMIPDMGPGPHSTPLLVGPRLFTMSATVKLHCLDKESGKVLWSHDLMEEMGASHMGRGYGASPLAFEELVIVNVGGRETGIAAFDQASGELVWKGPGLRPSHSSPILATIDGETQVLIAMGNQRAGLDPRTGTLRWSLELPPTAATTMSTQIWVEEENLLFGSAAYADGSRVIHVARKGDKFQAEVLWYSRQMRIMFGNAVRMGDYVYGSSGDFGPAFLTAIHLKTGNVAFRQRGFARAQLLRVGDRLLILDEDGDLALGTPGAEGIEIHSRAAVLDRTAWTVPTLVGTRLYLRNRNEILALDLGS